MAERLFCYGDRIVLDKQLLQPGAMIELCVMNYWIPGRIERDRTGWYLVSFDQVGIRLRTGLIARFPEGSHPWTYLPHHSQTNEQPGETS